MERDEEHFQIRVLLAIAAFACAFLVGWNTLRLPEVSLDGYLAELPTGTFVEASSVVLAGKYNLNTATEAELDTLEGIGPVLAARIVAYREANGPFRTVDELVNVSGIGEKTLNRLRENLVAE